MLTNKFRGITTFEVIVAIIVFGTGILVILSLLTKNVSWLRDIKQKDTATMLSKEWLEIVYNLRDTNTDKGIVWSCALYQTWVADNCWDYFHESNTGESYFEVSWDLTGSYTLNPIVSTWDTWLYYHEWDIESVSGAALWSWFWYSHNMTWGEQTEFRRYIVFKPVPAYADSTGSILILESHVDYEVGWDVRSVVLESKIGKTR